MPSSSMTMSITSRAAAGSTATSSSVARAGKAAGVPAAQLWQGAAIRQSFPAAGKHSAAARTEPA